MKKGILIAHRILFFANVGLLAASLIFYLIRWQGLPAEIGIHFAPDGSFDVIASKFYGFYPHVVGGIAIAGIAVATHIIRKKGSGLKLSEKGERLFKAELLLNLDLLLFVFSGIFSYWSYCVSMQVPLDPNLAGLIMEIVMSIVFIGIIVQIVTCLKYRLKGKVKKDNHQMHRLSRIIAWLLTACNILLLVEVWERYPSKPELRTDPAFQNMVYFENIGAYLDRIFLLIPYAAAIILLTVIEIIFVHAAKKKESAVMLLTDRLRLVCGLFFAWWIFLLLSENSIGIVSVCLFLVLNTIFIVMFVRDRKRSDAIQTQP